MVAECACRAVEGVLYSHAMERKSFRPADYQPELPVEQIILFEPPSSGGVEFDVLFVGAGPASLAGAIKLAQLVKTENEKTGGSLGNITIGIVEKSAEVGHHILSGAVINPLPFRELFPELPMHEIPFAGPVQKDKVLFLTEKSALRIPAPPTMKNCGNYVASLCQVVRWLAAQAQSLGVEIFTGFPVRALLVKDSTVIGVRTADSGRNRDGSELPNFQPGTDVAAKVVVLGEGTRGFLTQAYLKWQNISSPNPQIYALGVKEVWQLRRPLDAVVHTMGWPLDAKTFGGSFFYPLQDNQAALGVVVGLDYPDATTNIHQLLQEMKRHPFFRPYLDGGELLEWGAKTIPEGGYWSLPSRLSGTGLLLAGDAAGFVDVPSLKGVHYAMTSGLLAAKTIFEALKKKDFSAETLSDYDRAVKDSIIVKDLYRRRNMRLAFKSGLWLGGIKAGLSYITHGFLFGGHIEVEPDSYAVRHLGQPKPFTPDGKLTFRKLDAVFKSKNATRDNIPSHLLTAGGVDFAVGEFYAQLCPAGVYEVIEGKLNINPPNCIDCKATDVLAPRWTPREGGSGPKYTRM